MFLPTQDGLPMQEIENLQVPNPSKSHWSKIAVISGTNMGPNKTPAATFLASLVPWLLLYLPIDPEKSNIYIYTVIYILLYIYVIYSIICIYIHTVCRISLHMRFPEPR